ncbi:hypothetical protein SAMN05660443_2406 [Marinospirillum celere]|uniref:Type IV pilus assembly protein PilV n=1 Tax=Marinospirillum celere TaxID=1122252 RepID=A0A1I1IMG0_9GAMM|nr:prepilin-type N-terminal cleavage/methylation domain-containing protein [Marinospirillum celere]SFC37489.1 hypothetical protein SAMN05660443_2406 [Marinospirillum celere]
MKLATGREQGFSLIEILVASFVITFGLVGMVLMQTYSQQDAFRAHQLSLSGLYAQDMQERLRANLCYLSGLETDSEVESFLVDQLDDWRADHALSQRGWVSGIEALTQVADFEGEDGESYWRFELEIQPPQPTRSATIQTLLIDYREGGCES